MGATAVKLVRAGMTVVDGPFGPYARSKNNTVVSQRLKSRNNCIRAQLKGKSYSNIQAVWDGFRAASATCRGAGAGAPAAGRRMRRF